MARDKLTLIEVSRIVERLPDVELAIVRNHAKLRGVAPR